MKQMVILLAASVLLMGAVACTREKPPMPTPTLSGQPVLPAAAITVPTEEASLDSPSTPLPPITLVIPNVSTDQTNPPATVVAPKATRVAPAITVAPTIVASNQPSTRSGSGCPNPYIVQRGQYARQIARDCGVSYESLQAANPKVDLVTVYAGQALVIPSSATNGGTNGGSGPCGKSYIVKPGDTLYSIAVKCGTTVAKLKAANKMTDSETVYSGLALNIP